MLKLFRHPSLLAMAPAELAVRMVALKELLPGCDVALLVEDEPSLYLGGCNGGSEVGAHTFASAYRSQSSILQNDVFNAEFTIHTHLPYMQPENNLPFSCHNGACCVTFKMIGFYHHHDFIIIDVHHCHRSSPECGRAFTCSARGSRVRTSLRSSCVTRAYSSCQTLRKGYANSGNQ